MQGAIDLPARFIGGHDGAAADLGTQRRITGCRPTRETMERADEGASGHTEPTLVAEQRDDLAERPGMALGVNVER